MIKRILLVIAALLVIGVSALALTIQHTTDCPEPPGADAAADSMMAVMRYCYGPPEVLVHTEVAKPIPGNNEILLRVESAALNPLDYHYMRGSPYLMRLMIGIGAPDDPRIGRDFAGVVVAVGNEASRFEVGDRVFGSAPGAFAQFLVRAETGAVARIPAAVDFDQAAAIPVAGVTALQALRDHGQLQPGQRVLINGASGGVGTYAVQIAKSMGAHVTGVCSGRNAEMVRQLGADEVINYQEENYIESGQAYELVVDLVGNHSPLNNRKVLTGEGRLVLVGGEKGNWVAPLKGPVKAAVSNKFVDQELASFTAQMKGEDLETLAKMMAEGTISTRIDRRVPLAETADAMRYLETQRARGKVLVKPAL